MSQLLRTLLALLLLTYRFRVHATRPPDLIDNSNDASMEDVDYQDPSSSRSVFLEDEPEDDFCSENYVDAAYFNGYDTILTRGDRLWYYYKDRHRLSVAFDQRKFTQGLCILLLLLISCLINDNMQNLVVFYVLFYT